MKIPVLVLLLQGIPENIALTTFAFVISKANIEWKRICLIGVILALNAFVLRLLPITFGVHTIVNIAFLIIFTNHWGKVSLTKAVVSSFLGFIVLIIIEMLTHNIFLKLFNTSIETIVNSQVLWILLGTPQVLIMFFISYIIRVQQIKKMKVG